MNIVALEPPDMEALIGTPKPHGEPEHLLKLVWFAANSS